MARQKNEKAVEAERLYKEENKKLVEIAALLDVSPGTVRRWKHDYNWDGKAGKKSERNSERSDKKKANVRKEEAVKAIAEASEENTGLTDEERLFCALYAQSNNATRSYMKVFNVKYDSASVSGCKLLGKIKIREEIKRLKRERFESLLIDEDDIVDRYMRIALASIGDYLQWGQEEVPVITKYGPLMMKDEETGESVPVMKTVNFVRFRPSDQVDGSLISEVKLGRDGASVKLLDQMKAMDWLSKYFELHPEDKRKAAFEKKRMSMDYEAQPDDTQQITIYIPDNNRDGNDVNG